MLSRLVKIQLTLFGVITLVTLLIMSLYYVRIPQQLGVGRYDVTMELDDAGGLYPKAHVTYRGTEVGQVDALEVRSGGGVLVHMQINDEADIPSDSQAFVRSASVIGEQYVDFVPPTKGSGLAASSADARSVLEDGSVIASDRTDLPTTTDEVLSSADDFVQSIPLDDLSNTLDELTTAFGDSGDELSTLISTSSEFVGAANENSAQTVSLIDSLGPVLQTQKDMDPEVRSLVSSLNGVTEALAENDKRLATIFTGSRDFLRDIDGFADKLNPIFAETLADTASVAQVANAYDPAIEHALIVVPPLQQMFLSALPVSRRDEAFPSINLDLRAGFDPPVCTTGYPGANKFRDPNDKTVIPVESDTYCKVAKDSPLAVRGARNSPCPNDSNLRGPYAFSCGLVFNRVEVDRQKTLIAAGDKGGSSAGAEMITPDGSFFLDAMGGTKSGKAPSLQDLLTGGNK